MADCLNCKNCIRHEVYDGQWGRFTYDKKCSVGVFIIKYGKINPWDMLCDKYKHGESKVVLMTDEEKRKYDPYFK